MKPIDALIETVSKLRDPDTGCPWDIEQDHKSIASCLVDECCELLQTIERLDVHHMEEELGDVLLQVVMHAQMASERDDFTFDSVCEVVNEKLIRRHPHVFGQGLLEDSKAVLVQWDQIKAAEKKRGPKQIGHFKDLPSRLPSLMRAEDVYKQLQKLQIGVADHVDQKAIDTKVASIDADSVGKELFEYVAACREKGLDAEALLRSYTQDLVDKVEADAGND